MSDLSEQSVEGDSLKLPRFVPFIPCHHQPLQFRIRGTPRAELRRVGIQERNLGKLEQTASSVMAISLEFAGLEARSYGFQETVV